MTSMAMGIIPARLESSRIYQKALVDICGLPMVVHVLNRTVQKGQQKLSKVLKGIFLC